MAVKITDCGYYGLRIKEAIRYSLFAIRCSLFAHFMEEATINLSNQEQRTKNKEQRTRNKEQ
jgi:hypothetical protein